MSGRKPETACNRFAEKCEWRTNGCLEWTKMTTNGPRQYGLFSIGRRVWTAHRWLYEQVHGTQPAHIDVCHKCDNPRCVNIDHLFAGTRKENMQDAVRKGRTSHAPRTRGEKHGRAVLTEKKVKQMRLMREDGHTLGSIAMVFEISIAHVSRIVNNQSWRQACILESNES